MLSISQAPVDVCTHILLFPGAAVVFSRGALVVSGEGKPGLSIFPHKNARIGSVMFSHLKVPSSSEKSSSDLC